MNITFSFRLFSVGWASATVCTDLQSVEMIASYLSDALGDLLCSLVTLSENPGRQCFIWFDEPGEYRWELTRQEDTLEVNLWGTSRLQWAGPFDDFARAVLKGLDRWLESGGEGEYRELWRAYPFPTEALGALRSRLTT